MRVTGAGLLTAKRPAKEFVFYLQHSGKPLNDLKQRILKNMTVKHNTIFSN